MDSWHLLLFQKSMNSFMNLKKMYLYSSLYHSFLQVSQDRWFLNKPNRKWKYLYRVVIWCLFQAEKGAKLKALTKSFCCWHHGMEMQSVVLPVKAHGTFPFQVCRHWEGTVKLYRYFWYHSVTYVHIPGLFQIQHLKLADVYITLIVFMNFMVSSNFHTEENK